MYFLVSATHAGRAFAFERTSLNDALEKGLALLGSGMREVFITHPDGRRAAPADMLAALAAPRRALARDTLAQDTLRAAA